MRLRPEVRDYVRNGGWVHRGDVVTYGPNKHCGSFSTGPDGFRHSIFSGETLSVEDCLQRPRYGLVLGSSHIFGFGLPGNEHTIPSVLAERFGFPFANVGIPEASSRNMHSLLLDFIARASAPPAVVIHLSGGDFTSFCFTSIADPVFGSPNIRQFAMAVEERGGRPAPQTQIQPLLAFTSLWVRALADLCRRSKIPLLLGNDTTFFEKSEANAIELECGLGNPRNATQDRQFKIHKTFFPKFLERRESLAAKLGVPLAGPGAANSLGFVDEFHHDKDGTRRLCDDLAIAIEPLL